MRQPHIHVEFSLSGRFFDIPLHSDDLIIFPRRINKGIDFKANKDARKRLSANTYLLYMSLITLPAKEWILRKLNLSDNTPLTPELVASGFEELVRLEYMTQSSFDGHPVWIIWESPEYMKQRGAVHP